MLGSIPLQFHWLSVSCILKPMGSVGAEHEVFVESDQRAGVLQGSSSEGESHQRQWHLCRTGIAESRPEIRHIAWCS